MAVVEKLTIGRLEFYVNAQSELHIITTEEQIVISREETIELLNGLGRQLGKAESSKPLFTWPWMTTKKH